MSSTSAARHASPCSTEKGPHALESFYRSFELIVLALKEGDEVDAPLCILDVLPAPSQEDEELDNLSSRRDDVLDDGSFPLGVGFGGQAGVDEGVARRGK